jgi:hypothetical protein
VTSELISFSSITSFSYLLHALQTKRNNLMFNETFNNCFGSDPYLDDANNFLSSEQCESEPNKALITLDEQAWRSKLRMLATSFEKTKWEIGDQILLAESYFPDFPSERVAGYTIPGSNVYVEAERETGLSRALLYDLASTARRCPTSVRTERLSWSHHRIIVNNVREDAGEEEMMEWVRRAQEEGLTTRKLKEALAGGYHPAKLEKRFQVKVPLSTWETLKAFADLKGLTVQKVAANWLVEMSEQSQAECATARKAVADRRKARRRRVGMYVAKTYNSLRLDRS